MPNRKHPDSTQARIEILGKLRNSTTGRFVRIPEQPTGSFVISSNESPIEQFSLNLSKIGGICRIFPYPQKLVEALSNIIVDQDWKCVYCPDPGLYKLLQNFEIADRLISSFSYDIDASVTHCESLAAETGTIIVSSALNKTRQVSPYSPVHIVVATVSQLKNTLDEAFEQLTAKYGDEIPSTITAITGPSRTADIEKTLILGAHGPKTLMVFLSISEF